MIGKNILINNNKILDWLLKSSDRVTNLFKLVEIDGPDEPNCTHPIETNVAIREFKEYLI
jgi:hypothetical protein